VLDGDVWVRLGSKAAGRVDCTTTKPRTSIRIGDTQFDEVEMVHVPEMAERVSAAMADKYSTDIFIRWIAHPYTMKLVPKGDCPKFCVTAGEHRLGRASIIGGTTHGNRQGHSRPPAEGLQVS